MLRNMTAIVIVAVFVSGCSASEVASDTAQHNVALPKELELGAPFADNAVLQREMKVPVWGWHKPGTKVTVQFAGQKMSATAGKYGKWTVQLDPLKADFEPREMVITAGETKRTLKNMLVGEVWMASGQSNMQWKVAKSSCNKLKVEPKGKVHPIREFEVTSVYSALHPIRRATGAWKNGDYTNYSAIAFAFAHKLYEELEVPIGILNCSFSSTKIQAWVPREGFRDAKDEYTQNIYKKILETDPATPEHKIAWNAFYQSLEDGINENDARIKKGEIPHAINTKDRPGNLAGNRDATWLFNGRLSPVVPYAIRGAIWNQGYANMGEGLPYYNNLHSLIRGWRLVWDRPKLPVYFHQFYSNAMKADTPNYPSIGSCAEMRLGTWLARDIPNAGMASQIDITGGIHYGHKAVPGRRLALHALKNQYGRKLVVEGPMFKSYRVEGNKLIVEFTNAEGGLLVAETGSNAIGKNIKGEKYEGATRFADPKVIPNGEDQVTLFSIAGADRVWHSAKLKIDGEKVVLTAPGVKAPRGVSYATGGVGFQPNLYNKALLPMTPFMYYDNKMVTSRTWPDEKPKVAGVVIDPDTVGLKAEWRKMPLLSPQFRDNAVLQAGVPVTIWGSVLHDWGYEAKGRAVVKFRFAGIEKTIEVKDDSPHIVRIAPGQSRAAMGKEWRVTIPPMKAGAEPKTLKVTFTIDGEVAHEREYKNIVVGDVWYVASPPVKKDRKKKRAAPKKTMGLVRMMTRKAKRFQSSYPSRYSVCVSRTPGNRFASEWTDATGFAAALGNRIAAKTGKPVGIIFMQSGLTRQGRGKPSLDLTEIKSWINHDDLNGAPTLMKDYNIIGAKYPGKPTYNANIRTLISNWKKYWGSYIPEMIATKKVPDGSVWGRYPTISSSLEESKASQVYNCMTHSFTPAALKGVIFIAGPAMVAQDRGANFGAEFSVLVNSWKKRFGGDPQFFYTIPAAKLAPKITKPGTIKGKSVGVEISDWSDTAGIIDRVIEKAYK